MSPRKAVDDEFGELCFSTDDRASGKERKRKKSTSPRKKTKNTQASRGHYEFDTDFYDDLENSDYTSDYDVDGWNASYNPPYTR